jgi:VanZ family protein
MARLLAVLWTLAVLAALSVPGSALPSFVHLSVDKVFHAAAFLVLGLLWLRAYPHEATRVLVAGVLFAVLTEVYQHVMPIGRSFSLADAFADTCGLVAGVGLGRRGRGRAPAPLARP